jgi:hypothetical protein
VSRLPSARKTAFLILIAFLYLYLRGIGDHGLLDPLEGVNSSVALNMVARQSFFAPLAGDLPWGGKSLGFWWLESLMLVVFGWSEFAVRFLPALAAVGTALSTWFLSRRMKDESAANFSAVIAGTSCLAYSVSQLASPHALYVCLLSAALTGLVYAFRDSRFFLIFHVSAALAFLAYGPAGIVLPWLSLLLYALLTGQERFLLKAALHRTGLAATCLLTGGYLLLLRSYNPGLLAAMRFNPSPAFNTFVPALLLFITGFCPWTGFCLETLSTTLPRLFSALREGEVLPSRREDVLLSIWSIVFLCFGLFSGDGLLVFAAFPATAALCGVHFSEALENRRLLPFQRAVLFELLYLSAFLLAGLIRAVHSGTAGLKGTAPSVVPWFCFCLAFLFFGWYDTLRRRPFKALLHLCTISLLSLLPLAGAFDLLAQEVSVRDAGRFLKSNLEREDVVLQYAINRPSLFFYTARDSLLLNTLPIDGIEDQKILQISDLNRIWGDSGRVFMLIKKSRQDLTSLPKNVYNLFESRSVADKLVILSNYREKPGSSALPLPLPDSAGGTR